MHHQGMCKHADVHSHSHTNPHSHVLLAMRAQKSSRARMRTSEHVGACAAAGRPSIIAAIWALKAAGPHAAHACWAAAT